MNWLLFLGITNLSLAFFNAGMYLKNGRRFNGVTAVFGVVVAALLLASK